MNYSKLKCSHALFRWASDGPWHDAPTRLITPCVFVFERSRWATPTQTQLEDYRRRKETVQSLGGIMVQREHEIAGENALLSAYTVRQIRAAVRKEYPKAKIIAHWNGTGCYTMSVGVDLSPENPNA